MIIPLMVISDIRNTAAVKMEAFEDAKKLVRDKGIINIGCGTRRLTEASKSIANDLMVVVNTDVVSENVPNFIQNDIGKEPLPFDDKEFDVSFCSHVLEHIDDWETALNEIVRVSDKVVLVLPSPDSIGNKFSPEHKHYFSVEDIERMMRENPTVRIYY